MEKWVRETSGFELDVPNYEGVRVDFRLPGEAAGGWFLFRRSVHENAATLNIESDTEGASEKVLELINDFLSRYEGVESPQ